MENNNRYFQWVAGDRKGEVLMFDKIEAEDANVFIVFKDGSRINETLVGQLNQKDLTGKFMAEIDSPKNTWAFQEEWVGRMEEKWEQNADGVKVCVQPFTPGKKVVKLIPPKPTPPTYSTFGIINNSMQTKTSEPDTEESFVINSKIDKSDPVYILMSKSKKVESEIEMNITISLPPKNLYNIAKDSFDEGETKFVEYIIEDIAVDKVKDAIKIAIKQMYESPDISEK